MTHLHRHASAEYQCGRQIASMGGIAGGHAMLRVEHLSDQFGDGHGAVLVVATCHQRREARYEEVQSWKGYHVRGQFAQIRVQLDTWSCFVWAA